jgi:predicted nucleotidyltransferase
MTIQELKDNNLLLFECLSGSKAYGLDTPKSDTDIKGVFYLPKEQFFGLNYIAQVNNETNDEVYYELGRYVELLGKNNPNLLEMLASPKESVLYKHPVMDCLTIDMFLSKLCRETFAGYAQTQIRKARGYKKKVVNPVEQERKGVLDFCFIMHENSSVPLCNWLETKKYKQERCGLAAIPHTKGMFALFHDDTGTILFKGIVSGPDANEVSLSSIPKGMLAEAYLYFNVESYSAYCREYREYWDWVANRNEDRYQGNKDHGKDYDAKNMMHTIRLLQVAEEIGRLGVLNIKRNNREELLSIKNGLYNYPELLAMADDLMEQTESAFSKSLLPDMPDRNKVESILVQMRTELYH